MDFSEYRKYLIRRQEILTKTLTVVALIVAFVEIGRLVSLQWEVTAFVSSPMILSLFCLIPILVIIKSRRFTVNFMLLLFCLAAVISLIFNHPVANYMSTLRFCLFCGMLCLLSPLVDNEHLRQFRRYLWRYSIYLCQFVVIMSLVVYMVTLMIYGKGNLFIIVGNPIMLSTLSAMVAVVMTWRFLSGEKSKFRIALDCISFAIAVLLMVWGGARGAILGFAVAEIYVFVVLYDKWKSRLWVLVTIIATILLTVLMGGDVTKRVKKKFEIASEHNSIIFSRKQLWQSRIEEFGDSPLVGIGFANATRYSTLYSNRHVVLYDPDKREEPGSSWLCTLSNTGIVGFAILLWWNVGLLRMVRRRRRDGDMTAVKYGALLLFFIVEGFFEGWVLYAGSFVFFLYWLLSSRIVDYRWQVSHCNKPICGKCLGV